LGYEQTKYKPITQVVKEKRGCMNSHKLKLNQNLLQLKRFKDHIEFIKDENIKKVANKVTLHFSNIFKIVEDAEKRAMKKLESYHKTQERKVKELFDDLKDIEEIICTNKTKIQEYLNSQDEDVVKHIETIDQLVTHQIEILPKIVIPDFKINFISENADIAKVDKFLNTMYQYAFK
jgi:hypothetical protein